MNNVVQTQLFYLRKWMFLFILLPCAASAQDLTLQVIGAAGTHFETSAGRLTYTVGELMIQTAPGIGSVMLPQGFHQHMVWKVVSVDEPKEDTFNIRVFPNPMSTWLRVETDRPVVAVMFDPLGKPVSPPVKMEGAGDLQLPDLPAGFYVLRLSDSGGRLLRVFKLHRIH